MTLAQWCILISTFALFSVAVWNLVNTGRPCGDFSCRLRWFLWGLLNGALAVLTALWWVHYRNDPPPGEEVLCGIRLVVALLMLLPLRRRGEWHG